MSSARPFVTVRLPRSADFLAHVRSSDRCVIFSREQQRSEELFEAHEALLRARQGQRFPLERKKTFTLYLVLTDRCNLMCEYCDVLGSSGERRAGVDMSAETARRALEILHERLARDRALTAQLVFFGGEPLLRWELLAALCEELDAGPHADRVARMLVTNGTLITAERARFLDRHRVYVVVSLDGGPEVNDRVRRGSGARGSYEQVSRGLERLMATMPERFGISCTVGSHNAATLPDQIELLHDTFRPCSIGINIYHWQRTGSVCVDMDHEELARAMVAAFLRARQRGIAIYQYIGVLRAFVRRLRNLDYCPACVDKLLFSPQGRVGRCETLMYDHRFTVPLAEVAGGALPEHLDWSRFTPEHEPACLGCAARWICPGSCAYDQLVRTGDPSGVERRRCLLHQGLLGEMLELLLASARSRAPAAPVIVPEQSDFDSVAGGIPMTFPSDTIWIVSLASVVDEAPAREAE